MSRVLFYFWLAAFFLFPTLFLLKGEKDKHIPPTNQQPITIQDAKLPPPSELPPDGL